MARSRRPAPAWNRPGAEGLESRRLPAAILTGYVNASDVANFAVHPDGDVYFTENFSNGEGSFGADVCELTPSTGVIRHFLPRPDGFLNSDSASGITVGPDGVVWFAATLGSDGSRDIGSIDPSTGAVRIDPIPDAAVAIAAGPDGDVWFTMAGRAQIGSLDPSTGAVAEYDLGSSSGDPTSIVAGPDGNLWFTETSNQIGKFNPTTHAETDVAVPTADSEPASIIDGPGGKLWFAEDGAAKIASVDPSSGAIVEDPILVDPIQIAAGPGGDVVFNSAGVQLGGMSTAAGVGVLDPVTGASSYTDLTYIYYAGYYFAPPAYAVAAGPDGTIYFGAADGTVAEAVVVPNGQGVIRSNVYSDPSGLATDSGGPLGGVTVYVDLKDDGKLDAGDPTAVTNAGGYYTLEGLEPGTYTIRVASYPGQVITGDGGSSRSVVVAAGEAADPATFGVESAGPLLPLASAASPFGESNPDVATAEVDGLYNLLLDRAPDASGGANARAYLRGGGSVSTLAATILHSVEFDRNLVSSYYEDFLGRAGGSAEVAGWVAAMQGGWTAEQVASGFLLSTEYAALHPTTVGFVQSLYEGVLGRTGSAAELAGWTTAIGSGLTDPDVVDRFLLSTEAEARAVNGFYWSLLDGSTDGQGVSHVLTLEDGEATLADVAAEIAGSKAFADHASETVG